MFCPNCQENIPEGVSVCPFCGKSVEVTRAKEMPEQADKGNEQIRSSFEIEKKKVDPKQTRKRLGFSFSKREIEPSREEKCRLLDEAFHTRDYAEKYYAPRMPIPGEYGESRYTKILKGFAMFLFLLTLALVALYYI